MVLLLIDDHKVRETYKAAILYAYILLVLKVFTSAIEAANYLVAAKGGQNPGNVGVVNPCH